MKSSRRYTLHRPHEIRRECVLSSSDSLAAGDVSGGVQIGLEDELPKATDLIVLEHDFYSAIDGFHRSFDRDAVFRDSLPDVGCGLQKFF